MAHASPRTGRPVEASHGRWHRVTTAEEARLSAKNDELLGFSPRTLIFCWVLKKVKGMRRSVYTLQPPAQSADIVLPLFSFFLSPLSFSCVLSSSVPPSAPHPPHSPQASLS